MTNPLDTHGPTTVRDMVARKLGEMIARGAIPGGTRITEAEVTRLMDVGRTPVRQALERLLAEGTLARTTGRGYVVTPGSPGPVDTDPPESFALEDLADALTDPQPEEELYLSIEREVVSLAALGLWRLSVTSLCETYGLRRGKVEDALTRLQRVGLVAPLGQTRWTVVPLDTRRLDKVFSVRRWLEPNLLAEAVVNIPLDVLMEATEIHRDTLRRYPNVTGGELDHLEQLLHTDLLRHSHNEVGLAALESARSTLIFNKQMLATSVVPLVKEEPFIVEHLSILEAIRRRDSEECRLRLQAHLMKSRPKVQNRLAQVKRALRFDPPAYAHKIR